MLAANCMILEGDQSVIDAIKEKKRLMDAGEEHGHIRPLLVLGGGLMRGTYGLGAALALEELGYTNAFSMLAGVSSGSPTIAHFAAGSTKEGSRILIEDCASRRFVNMWRFWNQADTQYLIDLLRNDSEKKVDVKKVLQNPACVGFGVAEYSSAKPKLMCPTNRDQFFNMLHASINMQNVSNLKVFIDGVQYADGGFTIPHIYKEIVDQSDATHILIHTNNEQIFTPISKIERFLNRTIFRIRLNGALVQATNLRRAIRDEALLEITESETPAAIVWGNHTIGGMETDRKKIEQVLEASRQWWLKLLA